MAELADALASGASDRKVIRVQLPSSARIYLQQGVRNLQQGVRKVQQGVRKVQQGTFLLAKRFLEVAEKVFGFAKIVWRR